MVIEIAMSRVSSFFIPSLFLVSKSGTSTILLNSCYFVNIWYIDMTRKNIDGAIVKGLTTMTREEAARYIAHLTLKQKQQLNELLKSLAQTHPHEKAPQELSYTDE